MNEKNCLTALMSAFGRAYYAQNEPNPVFNDYLAEKLFSPEEFSAMKNYILSGAEFFCANGGDFRADGEKLDYIVKEHIAPTPVFRAAFTENALIDAAKNTELQYVILGAGLDTFAIRHKDFFDRNAENAVFEVDLPAVQRDKKERLSRAGFALPEKLHFVPADLSRDDLKEKLTEAGFDKNKKAFFSWLGVSYYLEKADVEKTLQNVYGLSAEGSFIAFDYPDEKLFVTSDERVRKMLALAEASGEKMKSCFSREEMKKLLNGVGFDICEELTPQTAEKRFSQSGFSGRLKLRPFETVNYVLASVKRGKSEKTNER